MRCPLELSNFSAKASDKLQLDFIPISFNKLTLSLCGQCGLKQQLQKLITLS